MLKKAWLLLTCVLMVAAIGYAQSSQTGTIVGTAILEDGSTVPGVKVTASSPALVIGQVSTVTNEDGIFRIANLPPGMYEISFQLEGFRTVIRKEFRVGVLQTFTVNATLKQEALLEAIVVTGQGPTVDTQRQTRAANFDLQFLKALPAVRALNSFVNMAPGMLGDPAGGGSSSSGSATMDNSYNLDGVNLGDPATGLSNISFGLDIMDEISIQSGGLSAEYGSVRGAMINVVTKSGGNRLTGGASFYFNHESLKGDNTKGTVLEGEGQTGNHLEFEPSFSIGGPVIKNKLWFFASASYNQQQLYAIGFPYNAPADTKTIIKITQPLPYFKLTFQPDLKNKFILSYNYSDRLNNNRAADRFHTENNTISQTTPTHVVNLGWNRYFSSNMYANFKVGVNKFAMKLDSNTERPVYYDYYTFKYADNGGAWRTQDHNYRDRYNINLDATTFINDFLGTHELKVGGEAQLARVTWKVYGVPDPVTGAHWNTLIDDQYFYGLVLKGDGFDRKDNMDDYFGFVQDTWRVNKHLTVNLGLRLEYNSLTWPVQGEAGNIPLPGALSDLVVSRSITSPITSTKWTTLAPRAGFIYDLFGDSKTLLKGSYARYTMPNQVGWVNGAHPNGWVGYLTMLDPQSGAPIIGSEWIWLVPATTKVGYKDYKLKAPYTDELTVGVERELFTDWSAGARYIQKWDRQLIHAVDNSGLDVDKLMATGELDWSKNWYTKTGTDTFDGSTFTVFSKIDPTIPADTYIINPPGAERNYQGLEITLNKRFSRGWALNASYVYGKSTGLISQGRGGASLGTSTLFNDPNAHIYAYGTLDLDSRHQFKLQGLLNGPLGINLSGYFRWMSGVTWTRQISSGRLGVRVSQYPGSVTILAEERGSRRLPDAMQLDLRLEKAFKISNVTLSVFADCFNVLNRGVATVMNSNNPVWVNSSNTTYPFGRMMTINTARYFQLGARIDFN
jgi:hypothetical protein